MNNTVRIVLVSLSLVSLFAIWPALFDPILQAFLPKIVLNTLISRGNVRVHKAGWLTDGDLHVRICGSGSPLPDSSRAGQCVAVVGGGEYLIFDAGAGSAENVLASGLPNANVSGIFISHFHSDHISDLGDMLLTTWLAGRNKPLTVFGPPGMHAVHDGFAKAYELDKKYRIEHHNLPNRPVYLPPAGAKSVSEEIILDKSKMSTVVLERENGFKVHRSLFHSSSKMTSLCDELISCI